MAIGPLRAGETKYFQGARLRGAMPRSGMLMCLGSRNFMRRRYSDISNPAGSIASAIIIKPRKDPEILKPRPRTLGEHSVMPHGATFLAFNIPLIADARSSGRLSERDFVERILEWELPKRQPFLKIEGQGREYVRNYLKRCDIGKEENLALLNRAQEKWGQNINLSLATTEEISETIAFISRIHSKLLINAAKESLLTDKLLTNEQKEQIDEAIRQQIVQIDEQRTGSINCGSQDVELPPVPSRDYRVLPASSFTTNGSPGWMMEDDFSRPNSYWDTDRLPLLGKIMSVFGLPKDQIVKLLNVMDIADIGSGDGDLLLRYKQEGIQSGFKLAIEADGTQERKLSQRFLFGVLCRDFDFRLMNFYLDKGYVNIMRGNRREKARSESFDIVTSNRFIECIEVSGFEEVLFWQINYMLKIGGLFIPGYEADKNEVLHGLLERNGFATIRAADGSVIFEKIADVPPFNVT